MDYSDLPFRVIISQILPFYRLEISGFPEDLCLFGYFRKDPTRKIFTVFNSLRVNPKSGKICIDIQKIRTLDAIYPSKDFINLLIKNSANWTSLESLGLSIISFTHYHVWFNQKDCFPRVTRFRLSDFNRNKIDDLTPWKKAGHFWENIQHLQISFFSQYPYLPLFEIPKFGANLRTLDTGGGTFFKKGTSGKVHLPKLERLDVHPTSQQEYDWFPVKNMTNQTMENIRHVRCTVIDQTFKHFKNMLVRCLRLQSVGLFDETSSGVYDISFLFQRPLKKIIVETSGRITWKKWDKQTNQKFLQNIECLVVKGGDETDPSIEPRRFIDDFNGNEFPKMHTLVFRKIFFHGPLTPICGKKLTRVRFFRVEGLTDHFFQTQDFTNLRKLELIQCGDVTGRNWNPLPSIQILVLYHVEKFTDWIFENLEMSYLEDLMMKNTPLLMLKKWKRKNTKRIKKLRINDFDGNSVGNDLFIEEDRFLKKLDLLEVEGMNLDRHGWEGWKIEVKKFVVSFCNCGDELFRGGWVKELEELRIDSCKLVEGKNWGMMGKLRKLSVEGDVEGFRKNFREFKKNLVVPVDCEINV